MACLSAFIAEEWSGSQTNSFLVFSRHLSGNASCASDELNSLHWLMRPINDQRSMRLVGSGKLAMGAVLS